jgi:hypothetical protein
MVARASSSSLEIIELEEIAEKETNSERAVENWARLLRTAWRVRRLQRYFGHLGQFLQNFGAETRERLKRVYTNQ